MLTPDQIAEFEERAASGEKPKHPGWQWNPLNRPFFNCDGAISSRVDAIEIAASTRPVDAGNNHKEDGQ